jgi:DNA-binding NarL/FixJ family response regulator
VNQARSRPAPDARCEGFPYTLGMESHIGSPTVPDATPPARRVLLVDDSPQVRQELRTLLPLVGEIEIVGEAADGREALRLAEALQPDVILLDLEMPVMGGYEAARQIKAACPSCRVVALTAYADSDSQERAAQAGVDLFLVKGVAVESLVQAISA